MSGMGTHEIVNLIKSSEYWEAMLQVAKDFRGLPNSEALELAKRSGLYRFRSTDAGIVLEPWIIRDPGGMTFLVSFEISRLQVNPSVESPKGKMEEVTAIIADEIKEHFEQTQGKPKLCPWTRSELRSLVAEIRGLYFVEVVEGLKPRIEKVESKAGRRLSLVARRYRRNGPMQLVVTIYASDSDAHAKRVFDPSVDDVPDGETLQTWINDWLTKAAER